MVRILSILAILATLGFLIFNYLTGNREMANQLARTKFQVQEAVAPYIKPRPSLPPSPTLKVLSKGTQVFQTFNNCGPASLSMALSYFDVKVSQHTLGDALRPYQVPNGDNDDKSTTLYEMEKKAQEYGFATYYRPGGDMKLIKSFISIDIPVIARTWTKPGEDIGHFRVIKGYDDAKGIIVQDDSLQGANLTYTYEEFSKLWEAFNYEYMVIVPKDKVEMAEVILGENLNKETAWENALGASEGAIKSDPSNVYPKFNKLVALYHLGKYQEAINLYEQIENNLPRRMLWYQIEPIVAYQKLGKFDKVFKITDNLIENGNRAFSEVYQIRGEIYESLGDTQKAKEEFDKVILYNKNFYKYW